MAKNSLKMGKKALCLIFAFLFSINTFAAVVTDNDGAAFITKAEFDSLKNTFQSQLNVFNSNIDNKITNAIASYVSGVKADKKIELSLNNSIREIRCMYYKNDTTTKDLRYVYCHPRISGTGTDWTCGYNGVDQHGTYCHNLTWNKKSLSATGERNMIDNLYLSSGTKSSAVWKGHYKNVIDEMTLEYNGSRLNASYGVHMTTAGDYGQGLWPPTNSLVYNESVTSQNWLLGTYLMWHDSSNGRFFQYQYQPFVKLRVGGYSLNTDNAIITDKYIITFSPETYYAFTPVEQKFFGFDQVDVCGSTSKTTGPTLHEAFSKGATLTWWTNTNQSTSCLAAFAQSNLSKYAEYNTRSMTAMVNAWDNVANRPSGDTILNSSSYDATKNRWIWPMPSFPYKHIKNWNQLYLTENDWAGPLCHYVPGDGTIRVDSLGNSHLSLNAGWPIVKTTKGRKYEMEISFKETTVDHLLFLNYGPFDSTNSTSTQTINTIKQSDITHDGDVTSAYPNAILVKKNKSVKFSFIADKESVLFLKWCDNVTSGSLAGGGTIVLPDTITETQLS